VKYFKIEIYGRALVHSGGELQRDGENVWLTSESGKRLQQFHETALLNKNVREITKDEADAFWKAEADKRNEDNTIRQELSDADKLYLRWLNAGEREKVMIEREYYDRHNFGG
jgi:hypothetical protein